MLCNEQGTAIGEVIYSSKSGNNFNHKFEWQKLSKQITNNRPYNYYPRGRVEIAKGKIKIFLSPKLLDPQILNLIYEEFMIMDSKSIKLIVDNSPHYYSFCD